MRVVLTHDLADYASALVPAAIRAVAAVVHPVEDPPVHRLEPVTNIRQRTTHDHAHGVIEIGLLDLILQIHRLSPVGHGLLRHISHELRALLSDLSERG